MILVIDPSQGFAVALLKSPDKQLIFHYTITHGKREFYIGFLKVFSGGTIGDVSDSTY